MEFRLLGLLEVVERGHVFELSRGRERALLAVLLLHANEPVSADRLIEELWTERQPEHAAKTLQVYVSRLRRSIGAERLTTTPAGYVLEVGEGELDSGEFERLAAEGRRALEQGKAQEAQRLVSRALDLWRGPALADFRFDSFAQPEIRRLEELRATARADLVEARLSSGQGEGGIGELEQLISESPLSERPRRLLMLALYRAGRQADALALYRQTRELLADQLGVEPGPELQALERAILNHDPVLAAPAPAVQRALARRSGRLLLLGGVLIGGAAAATVVVLVLSGDKDLAAVSSNSLAVIDPRSHRVQAAIGLADGPARLVTDGGSLWVGNDRGGTVSRLDQKSYAVTQVVATGEFPSDLAAGEGAVWVIEAKSGRLVKIDAVYGTVTARRTVLQPYAAYDRDREGLEPTSVATGMGSVWLTDGSTKLMRIDAATAMPTQAIETGLRLNAVAADRTRVWAISGPSATLIGLDGHGTVKLRLPIVSGPGYESPYPLGVAAGAGFVWVLNGNTATVTKIDPRQRTIAATIPIGVERLPVGLAAGEGAAWVANGDGSLARIDAATNTVTTIPVARRLKDVAVAAGAVWVTTGSGLANAGTTAATSTKGTTGRVRALPTTSCSPLYYRAGARPDIMIASDLPLQGPERRLAAQISQAMRFVLKQHRFTAGRYSVAYQSCDDSTADTGFPSQEKCSANAQAFARNRDVIAVLAPFNSSCTEVEIPIANTAPGGPLPMASFSNTAVDLTGPDLYYATGVRNYVRIIAADNYQAAAVAVLARRVGANRVYVLHEPYSYGGAIEAAFGTAAAHLDLKIIGAKPWNPLAKTYRPLADAIKRARADAVYVAGSLLSHGDKLVQDLRAVLGPGVIIMTPDGFTVPNPVQTIGSAAEGMFISVPGLPNERLPQRGKDFVAVFAEAIGEQPLPYSVYAAQATELLLKAIESSDGTRASVRKNLFKTRITNGILGNFAITSSGDTTVNAVAIYRIEHGKLVIFDVITPAARLLQP